MTDPVEPDRLPGAPHPRETAELFGQSAAETRFLEAAASGRLHHAWLLTGPAGVGKATLAWRIARHLAAGTPTLQMPADHPVFRQAAALASPQIFLCRRPWDDKTERLRTAITVDEIRALKTFFQLSAADAGWRVAIIDSADEMTGSAANALLKILEEPPARAVLLLVSHRPAALLPTLRSRTRELRCAPLAPADLAAALEAAGAPPGADAPALAALAQGSVGAAFRLAAEGGVERYAEIAALLASPPLDRRRLVALADGLGGRDATRYALLLELTRIALGRLALAGAGADIAPLDNAEAAAMARLAATPAQGRLWAELATRIAERTTHARAVNLDPAQVILDTFLLIDAAAAEALAHAA
ncbi:MAG: DNA polymerase III subunit delta' [Amaricoccus sp.]